MISNWTKRALKCLLPAAEEFREYQAGLQAITGVTIKTGDESLATITDRAMEKMVLAALADEMPQVAVFAEEGSENAGAGEYYMYFDPVDGTREMTTETSLSVMILALMRRAVAEQVSPDDRLVGTIISEPSTGRFWAAEEGSGCWKFIDDARGGVRELGQCSVWTGPISTQSSVFLDSSQGFVNTRDSRRHRQMLTDARNVDLYGLLNPHTHVRILGPNGQIQALIANGGHGAAGSMSLALGWPWDACGALLVIEAGGAARALSVDGRLCERDPLCPNSYDFLVCANDKPNVSWLTNQLIQTYLYVE